jgi:Na+/H+ antiporter NhaD/arsenite permease-like protein
MPWRVALGTVLGVFSWPALAAAAGGDVHGLPVWTVVPFVGLLLAIALLPLVAGHFWHSNLNRALVSFLFAAPVAAYLVFLKYAQGQDEAVVALLHGLEEYATFILLLAALYTVAGGVLVELNVRATPLANVLILAVGGVLANLIGTTGASMLLIRPYLRINRQRQFTYHLPIFFIFIVSNLGGLLTPLGDPPLFLGFLRGVEFFWTMNLWPQWLVANGAVLGIFLFWDTLAVARERRDDLHAYAGQPAGCRVRGLVNLLFLGGILAVVLFRSERVSKSVAEFLSQFVACPDLQIQEPWGAVTMVALAVLSLLLTPRGLRRDNAFSWSAIIEVAVLFAGIFVTMVPALELLKEHGPSFGLNEPWQFFWLTGSLSSFLDNAPTYLTFATMAASDLPGKEIAALMTHKPQILQAISSGAVFLGAMTYIGNGPNFMVKAIAEENGYRTPSFFGYMAYSVLLLLPVFVLVTYLFFRPPGW